MAELVMYPNEGLRTECEPIKRWTKAVAQLGDDLLTAAREARGYAMAAPQINGAPLVQVFAGFGSGGRPLVICNPRIVALSDSMFVFKEGCLSIPDQFWYVSRPDTITIEYQDVKGKKQILTEDKIIGRMLQHEIDHLNGKLVIDLLTLHERKQFNRRMKP